MVYMSAVGGNGKRRVPDGTKKAILTAADAAIQHPTLAEKLTRLFQTVRSPDGDEYTYGEVVAEINARGIAKTSGTYLCDLRIGKKDNPRIKQLEAIAEFFGVPVTYFLDGDESAARIYTQLAALPVYGDPGVERMVLLVADLSPKVREAIAEIIEHAHQIG